MTFISIVLGIAGGYLLKATVHVILWKIRDNIKYPNAEKANFLDLFVSIL